MSDAERIFASENHNLIYSFLHSNRADPEEYYDIAALGYLGAVMRYFRTPRLRNFPFSCVAWKSMQQSLSAFRRTEAQRAETERQYLERNPPRSEDLFSELEADLLLHDLVSFVDPRQYALASMRLQGYSIAEIARVQGIPARRVSQIMKTLYRVYLKLYKE